MADDRPAVAGGPDEAEDTAQTGIDTTLAHSARIWNYWLGGKDNISQVVPAAPEQIPAGGSPATAGRTAELASRREQ